MALQHLSDEQVRSWTRAQKDEWWLRNVYRGDVPQLTLRSGLTGFVLGLALAGTALYIGAKTGVAIGVGLTSVLLSFAFFRMLHSANLARDFTILENNCTQSIATAAGYMIQPLVASLASYMLVTGRIVPWWQMAVWMVVMATLGVLVAFPMKRRFINDDQLPFPEGRASAVVLDSLYTGHAASGVFKARLLTFSALGAALYQMLVSDGWMKLIELRLLWMDRWAGLKESWSLHERLDSYYYEAAAKFDLWIPRILGVDLRQLGLRLTLDVAMLGVGGLVGMRVASCCMLGAFINFVLLAPLMIQRGDIVARIGPGGAPVPISRIEIVNQWGLWWAVTMMVVGALVGLLGRPEVFVAAFRTLRRLADRSRVAASRGSDPMRAIELPLRLSALGVPVFCVLGCTATHEFFGVPWLLAFASLPLILVLTVICANSMALTSWTPTGALAKITQFSMGAIDRGNPASNLIPAGMTAEVAANASNLLSDIKPGYMLGAKPRQQAIGHMIGIVSGALACIPLFFLLFLPPGKDGARSTATIVSDQFAFPAAMQWKGVAELIANGISHLPASALVSIAMAAACAAMFEFAAIATRGRFPLSAVSIGLGVVIPPESTIAMWLGALLFWALGRRYPTPGTRGHACWTDGREAICAGLISGAALMGIGNAIINVLMT
jgi:OPT family oligopeptide transporter